MTGEEWFTAATGTELTAAAARLDPRRRRLLATAVCRRMGRWVDFPAAHAALDAADTFADTGKTKAALRRARQAMVALRQDLYYPTDGRAGTYEGGFDLALFTVQVAASENSVSGTVTQAIDALLLAEGGPEAVWRGQLYPVYHDIAGPLNPPVFDPAWRTATAVALARGMYESRDFGPMPVLADALDDAGCGAVDLLAHCRDPLAAHVRGCWVLDLVLGRT